ncbi:hypothetical protein AB0M42_19730 [Streptomyces sp. NPDC051784]|uniref:hypothetical protein n=1 Tax=Streptomyces sp. NPDC051784 TaxID=3155805 RepID=UPI00341A2C59
METRGKNVRYQNYDASGLPDWLAMVLGVMIFVALGAVVWMMFRIGPRKNNSPEARARAASRRRQARLRKRRTALQRKTRQRTP